MSPDKAKISPPLKENNLHKADNRTKQDKIAKDKDNNKLTKENMKPNNLSQVEKLVSKEGIPEVSAKDLKNHHRDIENNNLSPSGKPPSGNPPEKTRLSSTEKRRLADIVQQNMERHQQRTQHLR